jgi:hypothetical protein
MKNLGFIAPVLIIAYKKTALIYQNYSYKKNNFTNLYCKYDFECKLPYTCYKIFGDHGVCKYNKDLIPIPIPIDK